MRSPDSYKTLLAAIQISASSLLLNILSIPVTALIIRKLGKEGYGEWMAGVSITALIFSLCNFGYRTLFIRRIAEGSIDEVSETANQLNIRILISIFALLISISVIIILKYELNVVFCTFLSAGSLLVSAIGSVFADILQGKQDLKRLSVINLVSGLVLTSSTLLVILFGGEVIHVALAYTSGPIIYTVFLYNYVRKKYFKIFLIYNKVIIVERVKESYLIGISGIASTLSGRIEHIFIPKIIGISSYGVFVASISLSDRLSIVSSSIADAFFSPIARASEGAIDSVKQLILTVVMVCIPISFVIIFLADVFASILFPKNINDCAEIIRIAALSLPIAALAFSMNIAMVATRAHDEAAKTSVWASVVSIAMSLWLIFHYGILGAAISQLTRPLIGCFAIVKSFNRRFPKALYQIINPSIALCSAILAIILWLGSKYLVNPINEIIHNAPWVVSHTEDIGTALSTAKTLKFTFGLIAYSVFSLFIYIFIGLYLKIIPRNSVRGLLMRINKRYL